MTRKRVASILTWIAAAGYLGTAALHSTGYEAITRFARQGPEELRALAPALWLGFSFDLVVLGLVVAVIAARPSKTGRVILGIAALCPISAAGLQVMFLGFIPPTALLLAVGGMTLVAAVVLPDSRRDNGSGVD